MSFWSQNPANIVSVMASLRTLEGATKAATESLKKSGEDVGGGVLFYLNEVTDLLTTPH